MIAVAVGWFVGTAHAERPITLHEALVSAVEHNGSLLASEISRKDAEGAVLEAKGQFDPLYALDLQLARSRDQGFFQGSPFEASVRTWDIGNTLTGTTGTGTTYDVSLGLGREQSSFILNTAAGTVDQPQDAFSAVAGVAVTQELLRGIRFRYNVQNITLARRSLDAAALTVDKTKQETLYLTAEAYWTWAYQAELYRIATEAKGVADEALRVGRLQVERGQLAPVEATRLEAALVQARQDELDAEKLAAQAANQLLLIIGEDPGQDVVPATAPGDVPVLELVADAAIKVALAQNLDLALARQELETTGIVHANAKHALLPSLAATIAAGVGSQRCPDPATAPAEGCVIGNALDAIGGLATADNEPYGSIGGVLSVPIGNRTARGARDRAAAGVALAQRTLDDLERQVAAAVQDEVLALRSARQRMELADANTRLAEETLSAEEALALAGRTIQKNVLEARTEVSRTKAEAAKARTDYQLAQARLLALQGQLTETSDGAQ